MRCKAAFRISGWTLPTREGDPKRGERQSSRPVFDPET